MLKNLQTLLHSEVAKMPASIKERKNVILTVSITSTLFLDILSFSIKGAQIALSKGIQWLALILMILYFVRQVLQSTLQTYIDDQKTRLNSDRDSYLTANISEISNVVRGKVFHTKNDYSLIMTNAEVIFNLKEFISYVWYFIESYPLVLANSLSAVFMIFAILITEFIETQDLKLTLIFSTILIGCVILFSVIFKIRLSVKKNYRDNQRILRKENDVLLNDIKNIEPVIKSEFSYRIQLLVSNLQEKRSLEKKELFKLNGLQVLRTMILGIFMILIIIIKLHFSGEFSISVLTDIIAVSTVYSNILNKITSLLSGFENLVNTIKDAERVKPDVDNIMNVFESEVNTKFDRTENIEKISIKPFEFSYPSEVSVYKLRNCKSFELYSGSSFLVYGHTGCGKSTFMHLIIGKIKMEDSPISYGERKQNAYLSSIMHESNGRLGANPVLQEIIFSSDISQIDRPRIIEILHGTHIYEDILKNMGLTLKNDEKVLEYLNSTTIEQYSSGQKQRLAIVKVLYNLSTAHKIVVFDEATNALDDNTAISVLEFMANFCQKDMKRIVLFVSHQVELTKKITDGSITFASQKRYDSKGNESIIPGAFDIVIEF